MGGHIQAPLHKHTKISGVCNCLVFIKEELKSLCVMLPSPKGEAGCIKMEPWMEGPLNEISLLMSILTHIRLSGQRVHSRDGVSIVTYANLVLLSEMHES